ncbi:hypothetical protein Ptr902_09179 [Pyrenophora tritici-repentis]|nr:hypothetical protein Ptr902_12980 [Pyrenophora tritici-repentis]KAI2479914.1 hypothetical protein Ptr902_09179 [Pyrenophora tritici-repentis]
MPTLMTPPHPNYIYDTGQPILDMPDHHDYFSPIMKTRGFQQDLRPLTPYPLYDDDHEVDIYSGHGDFFRPGTGENLRAQHRLPTPEVYNTEHDLPVIKPDIPWSPKTYDADHDLPVIKPDSYLAETSDPNHDDAQSDAPGRSQTELVFPPRRLSAATETFVSDYSRLSVRVPTMRSDETFVTDHNSLPVRVPTMRSDTYQPAMGGLHRLANNDVKRSKRDRIKRFICGRQKFAWQTK